MNGLNGAPVGWGKKPIEGEGDAANMGVWAVSIDSKKSVKDLGAGWEDEGGAGADVEGADALAGAGAGEEDWGGVAAAVGRRKTLVRSFATRA